VRYAAVIAARSADWGGLISASRAEKAWFDRAGDAAIFMKDSLLLDGEIWDGCGQDTAREAE
jgi:hypothetical protein